MDDIYKVVFGFLTMVLGWCYCAVQRNTTKHEKHDDRINVLERTTAVADEQRKLMLVGIEDVKKLGEDIKTQNKIILKVLARKSKGA